MNVERQKRERDDVIKMQLRLNKFPGFLLSMAGPLGIQYLHRDWFQPSLAAPVREYTNNTWGCLIPQAFHQLSKSIEKWHTMDVNWLMIYLATEMCSLPSSRLGGPGLKPEEAYFVLLGDLVSLSRKITLKTIQCSSRNLRKEGDEPSGTTRKQ